MATLVLFETSIDGVDLDTGWVAADPSGDEFYNNDSVNLLLRNNGATDVDVTFDGGVKPCNFGVQDHIHDKTIVVPAGQTVWVGPFNSVIFNDLGSKVHVSYSDATDMEIIAMNP